jgi:hypothetical protein
MASPVTADSTLHKKLGDVSCLIVFKVFSPDKFLIILYSYFFINLLTGDESMQARMTCAITPTAFEVNRAASSVRCC